MCSTGKNLKLHACSENGLENVRTKVRAYLKLHVGRRTDLLRLTETRHHGLGHRLGRQKNVCVSELLSEPSRYATCGAGKLKATANGKRIEFHCGLKITTLSYFR